MKYFVFILSFSIRVASYGQTEIPSEMNFAGMRLKLSEPVKRALKADVDLITKNLKYFQTKVDRADIYFPIMEKIFSEAGFPEDFKYLALQESSLMPDAVSSSNAVGYWQFKKETAQEVGLRVDYIVDERMNIAASSRGAATYLKKNNFYLNNWVYALLSYNLGLGGVKSFVKDKYRGASEMLIDDDMHWYVIRFLAHKLAYERAVGKKSPAIILLEEKSSAGKSISEISKEKNIDQEIFQSYNKWLLAKNSPEDRDYSFILPLDAARGVVAQETKVEEIKVKEKPHDENIKITSQKKINNYADESSAISAVERLGHDVPMLVTINKLKAIMAVKGDNISKLTLRAGIRQKQFLKFNDLRKFDEITAGHFYYLQPKRNKALVLHHTVQHGEDIAMISQKYGITQKAIRKRNLMDKREALLPGRVLWLRMKRLKGNPVEIVVLPKEAKIRTEPTGKEQETKLKSEPSPVKDAQKNRAETSKNIIPVSEEESGRIHEVKTGETLYSISRIFNVPADSLKKWNNLSGNDLKIGQQIMVRSAVGSEIIHVVTQGETIYKISKFYGVSTEDIKLWNALATENLEVGKTLVIKRK